MLLLNKHRSYHRQLHSSQQHTTPASLGQLFSTLSWPLGSLNAEGSEESQLELCLPAHGASVALDVPAGNSAKMDMRKTAIALLGTLHDQQWLGVCLRRRDLPTKAARGAPDEIESHGPGPQRNQMSSGQ